RSPWFATVFSPDFGDTVYVGHALRHRNLFRNAITSIQSPRRKPKSGEEDGHALQEQHRPTSTAPALCPRLVAVDACREIADRWFRHQPQRRFKDRSAPIICGR